jgi:hypothetical protein
MNRRELLSTLFAVPLANPTKASNVNMSQSRQNETEAVRAVLLQYFKGQATADPDEMRKPFLPTAHIEGVRDGKFTSWSREEFCRLYTGKPAPDEATRTRVIDSIDISGMAAMAKATLVHGATTFTDYFVLLKVDGRWAIANKVYHGEKRRA